MTLLFSKYYPGSFLVMLSVKNNGKKVGTIFCVSKKGKWTNRPKLFHLINNIDLIEGNVETKMMGRHFS